MKFKKIILLLVVLCTSNIAAYASQTTDIESFSQWLYASYSFGEDISDDTIIGDLKLYGASNIVYPVTPSPENGNCSFQIDGVSNDSSIYRTVKGGRKCIMAVKHYCSSREKDKRVVNGYIYFDAGKNFDTTDNNLIIEIEYFDEGNSVFDIMYVNGETTLNQVAINRENTCEWKKRTIEINDAYFNKDGATKLGDGNCDFRIEALGGEVAIGKVSVYNYMDSFGKRSYKAFSLGDKATERTYFTQRMWTADSKNIIVRTNDGWVYKYNIETENSKRIAHSATDFYVTPNNNFYYVNTSTKTINRINLDTYDEEILTVWPANANQPNYIHVNNNDTKLTVLFSENSADAENRAVGEDGTIILRNRRIPIYNIETGEWDLRFTHEFPDGTPHMTHLMINPAYDNLIYFCHEGTTTKIPDRMWLLNTETGEQKNIFVQQKNSLGADSEVKTGETSGHEGWTEDGEHMVFVKYPYNTNVGMNGIVRIDKYGESREYINNDYRYWHCNPSSDNRFVTADTMLEATTAGTNVNMNFGTSNIILVDSKNSSSTPLAKIKAGVYHPYQPHPAFSPNGKLVAFACVNEDDLLQVGIVDITDITAHNPGEKFMSNTNEDHGAVVCEPVKQDNTASVKVHGTNAGVSLNFFGAKYNSNGIMNNVNLLSDEVSKDEDKILQIDNISENSLLYLWSKNGVPFSFVPSAPENLRTISHTSSNVTLNWQKPVNLCSDGIQYEVWRDDEQIGTVSDGYFKDTSMLTDGEYKYKVRAVYPNGTISPFATVKTDIMNEIYYTFEQYDDKKGLNFLTNNTNMRADSYTEEAYIDGVFCRKSTTQLVDEVKKTGKFYYMADKSITQADNNLYFTVTYYDNGTNPIYIQYNAADGSIAKSVLLVKRTGTNKWMTAGVSVNDAGFVHAVGLTNCDFRVEGGADTYIHEVKVRNNAEKAKEVLQNSYCKLGSQILNDGLIFYDKNSGDSQYSVIEENGISCILTNGAKYMYFDVDDRFIYGSYPYGVSAEIEYFDKGTSVIMMQYNTNDPTYTFNTAYKECKIVKKEGTNTWKKSKILLVDTCFMNKQDSPYNADFRIYSSDGAEIKSVKLTAIP